LGASPPPLVLYLTDKGNAINRPDQKERGPTYTEKLLRELQSL
jgi:hypothetical protein